MPAAGSEPRPAVRIVPLCAALALMAAACGRPAVVPPKGGVETGIASWYGQDFHGRPTSSREIYDMNDMTAAHQTLPFGTHVMVTNLDNGRSAVVRINDRGPFVKGRVIDLSYAAASVLGVVGPGTARVRLETLAGSREPDPRQAGVWVQVGAFSAQENAYALKKKLDAAYPGVAVTAFKTASATFFRVRVKAEPDSVEALAARLAGEGFPVIIVRDQDSRL
jgi:rare lipoprotein A